MIIGKYGQAYVSASMSKSVGSSSFLRFALTLCVFTLRTLLKRYEATRACFSVRLYAVGVTFSRSTL